MQPLFPLPSLKLPLLIALIVGSIIGGGIFNLAQNLASQAGGYAIFIGWIITGVGMLMLCFVYETLAIQKPELNNGIYAYADALGGELIGFYSAWGYWVSAWIGNVGYLIALSAALGYFFPSFGTGDTPIAILSVSILLWLLHGFVLRGITSAALLNAFITIAKILPLLVFILYALFAFSPSLFESNLTAHSTSASLFLQIKHTMLITTFVFIGIEGASVYSAQAAYRKDIGKATLIGFMITLLLLISISLLSLGILPQQTLANAKHLAMAEVLEKITGQWGALFIVGSLFLCVGGALLSWTLFAAQALFTPATAGVAPAFLSKQNRRGAPVYALWVTNGLIQLFLIITLFSQATYLVLISLSTSMILIPYLLSALYAVKVAISVKRKKDIFISISAALYCIWVIYAAGIKFLLLSTILYLPGLFLYLFTKQQTKKNSLRWWELLILVIMILLAIITFYLLITHRLTYKDG